MSDAVRKSRMIADQNLGNKSLLIDELKKLNKPLSQAEAIAALSRSDAKVVLDKFITADEKMLKLKSHALAIKNASKSHCSVLITGPSGTGKELIARAFEEPGQPFVAVNCSSFTKELISSLLFGHLKGTFTGADSDKDGLLVKARNGVVFLDEIGDFPEDLQPTLLRAIQERVVVRLGDVNESRLYCRFVAATKYDLRSRVELGQFREDLFARLTTFELRVTGLVERKIDIPLIAEQGLDLAGNPLNWKEPIPTEVLPDIYRFNVRAIQTYVQRMRTYGCYS